MNDQVSLSLAQRLALSPQTPEEWERDDFLEEPEVGREIVEDGE